MQNLKRFSSEKVLMFVLWMRQIQFVLQYEHIYDLLNIYTDCKQVEPHLYMQLKNTEWVLMLSKRCGENARKANKMDKQQKETVQAVRKVVVLVCFQERFELGFAPLTHVSSLCRPAGESCCKTLISCCSRVGVTFLLHPVKVIDINMCKIRYKIQTSSCQEKLEVNY